MQWRKKMVSQTHVKLWEEQMYQRSYKDLLKHRILFLTILYQSYVLHISAQPKKVRQRQSPKQTGQSSSLPRKCPVSDEVLLSTDGSNARQTFSPHLPALGTANLAQTEKHSWKSGKKNTVSFFVPWHCVPHMFMRWDLTAQQKLFERAYRFLGPIN